jgi:hypothetical protein
MSLTIDARREDLDLIFPLFLLAQRKRKRHRGKKREGKRERVSEVDKMLGDRYERPGGSGKAPMDPDVAFM